MQNWSSRVAGFVAAAMATMAIGCQQVDLSVINNSTDKDANVFIYNTAAPPMQQLYGSVQVAKGDSSTTSITLATGAEAGIVSEVKVIVVLTGGANQSEIVSVDPTTTPIAVTITAENSITITKF